MCRKQQNYSKDQEVLSQKPNQISLWPHRNKDGKSSRFETGVEADNGGRVSIAPLKLLRLGPQYGHFSQNNNSVMP